MNSIKIGDRVLIAHNVNIVDTQAHSFDHKQRHEHFKTIIENGEPASWDDLPGVEAEPIVVEDDVWISFGVTILKGVCIGARSVIAAGSIVTKDVPPDTLYRCKFEPVMTSLKK
jgi:maltose O-acetyltransferase